MALFELASALSCELEAAYQLRDRLSETTAVQQLAEGDQAETLDKITVGIAADPFEGDHYSVTELETQHFFAQIYAETEGGHVAASGPDAMGNPREGGLFRVYFRRQVRESEDRRDAYNFFWDRISAIGQIVVMQSEQQLVAPRNYRFVQIDRQIGPEFGTRKSEGDEGLYLFALLTFVWGDLRQE